MVEAGYESLDLAHKVLGVAIVLSTFSIILYVRETRRRIEMQLQRLLEQQRLPTDSPPSHPPQQPVLNTPASTEENTP